MDKVKNNPMRFNVIILAAESLSILTVFSQTKTVAIILGIVGLGKRPLSITFVA